MNKREPLIGRDEANKPLKPAEAGFHDLEPEAPFDDGEMGDHDSHHRSVYLPLTAHSALSDYREGSLDRLAVEEMIAKSTDNKVIPQRASILSKGRL